MTLPNYGIPELAASQELLTDAINANVQDLANVAIAAVGPVVEAVQANAADLGKIQASLNRSFGKAVALNAGQLASVAPLNITSAPTPRDVLDPTDPPTCGAPVATPPLYNPGNVVTDVTGSVCPAFGPLGPPAFITVNNTQVNLSGTYGSPANAYYYNPANNTVYEVKSQPPSPPPPPGPPPPPSPPAPQTGSPPPPPSGGIPAPPPPGPAPGVPPGAAPIGTIVPTTPPRQIVGYRTSFADPCPVGNPDFGYTVDGQDLFTVAACTVIVSPLPPPSPPPAGPPPPPTPLPPPSPGPLPPPGVAPSPPAEQCIPICLVPPPGQSPPPPGTPPGTLPPTKPPAQEPPVQAQPIQPGVSGILIPLPGTPDWCIASAAINAWLAGIGASISGRLDDQLSQAESFLLTLAQPPPDSEWSVFGTIFTGIMRDIVAPVANLSAAAVHGIRTVITALGSDVTFAGAGVSSLVQGLFLVRGVWSAVKNFSIGSDVWTGFHTKLGEAFPEINQILDYLVNQVLPLSVPSPSEAMEAFLQGQITQDIYQCWLLIHGADPGLYQPILASRRDRLTTHEAIEFGRRTGLSDPDIAVRLRNLGWLNVAEANSRITLYDELPSQADFLHYLQRNVYNKEYVAQYDLLNGFEDKYWANFGTQLHAIGITKERAALDFAAHWILPAPTQMHEFIYRLRPDKVGVQNPFTLQDFENLLAEQDISPRAAKWFVETAYRVPALGYLRDMYRQNIIDDDQLRSYHEDLGYTLADSTNFVAIDSVMKRRQRASGGHGWTPAAIASAYSIRQMTPETVVLQMAILGYDAEEAGELMERADIELQRSVFMRARSRALTSTVTQVSNAIKVGLIDVQTARQLLADAGWPSDFAANLANSVSISAGVDRVKQIVSAVRKAFLAGEVDSPTAQTALAQSGIVPDMIAEYLTIWTLQNTPRRKRRTAAQIVNDIATNQMSTDEGMVRLINLGYDDADSRLFLADAQRKITAALAKQQAIAQRADKASQATLARLARAAQSQARALVRHLERLAPVSKLQKWAKLGIISHSNFLSRMELYGFDPLTAETYWKEACDAKGAKCSETQTNGIPIGPGEPGVAGP